MAWEKASAAMMARLAEALAGYPCQARKMFGSTAYFVGDAMFAGVLGSAIMLRMDTPDREALFARYSEEQLIVAPMGRRMKEYLYVPAEVADDPAELDAWLARAHRYAASLPAKPVEPDGTARSGGRVKAPKPIEPGRPPRAKA